MTNSNRLQTNYYKKLFIILFTILSSNSWFVRTESDGQNTNLLIVQDITTCEKNSPGSTLFKFEAFPINSQPTVEDSSHYEVTNSSGNLKTIKLKKEVNGNIFTFNITIDSNIVRVNGTFNNLCGQESNTSSCTVIIAFLASLCLILFTALALTLIILRRKKPITFKFGQKEDKDYDRNGFNENYDESYDNQNKSPSIDVTNIVVNNKSNSVESPRILQPRKSSLKPSKSLTDQLNNNFSSHENGAFNGTELEVVDEVSEEKPEDKPEELKPDFQGEARRKSIVTFSEKTQVKYG